MAGTISTTTSSLASELLLNKIMNGQVQASTGKSVTAAGRAVANRLSATAYELRTAEANMEYGIGAASAAQGELSSIKDQLNKMKENLISVMNKDAAKSEDFKNATSILKQAVISIDTNVSNAKYNGKTLLGQALTLNAGNNTTIDAAITTGATKFLTDLADIKSATVANAKKKADVTKFLTKLNAGLATLEGLEGQYGSIIKTLQNRQLLLAEDGANLDTSAAAQSVASLNGAGNLLASILNDNA